MAVRTRIHGLVLLGISLKATATIVGEPPRPANKEVVIEQEHVKDNLDSLMIIISCINMVDEGFHDGHTYKDLHYTMTRRRRQSKAPTYTNTYRDISSHYISDDQKEDTV